MIQGQAPDGNWPLNYLPFAEPWQPSQRHAELHNDRGSEGSPHTNFWCLPPVGNASRH